MSNRSTPSFARAEKTEPPEPAQTAIVRMECCEAVAERRVEGRAMWKARGWWRAAVKVVTMELSGRGEERVTKRPMPVVLEPVGCGVIGLRVCGSAALVAGQRVDVS